MKETVLQEKSLSGIGFSKYTINTTGEIHYKIGISQYKIVSRDKLNRVCLLDDNGNYHRFALKTVYRYAFNTEFCEDNIINLPCEEWKPIEDTKERYYISNYGRVKSYCGYTARILLPYIKKNGYLTVKINKRNEIIHRLVAFAYCENPHTDIDTDILQIHHKNGIKSDNYFRNLEILTAEQHQERHRKKEKQDDVLPIL